MPDEAIIVENKVYASLYNNLNLYWEKPNVDEENKRGVVLSLNKIYVKNTNFVNITHEELAKEIEKQLPSYFLKAQPKALILLQDFIQNIYNMTHPMDPNELKFYFRDNNRQTIRRLADIDKTVREYISKTITDRNELLVLFDNNNMADLVVKSDQKDCVYYVFNKNKDIRLKLKYASIWDYEKNDCRIRLFLVIKNGIYKFVKEHETELEEYKQKFNNKVKTEKDTYLYYKWDISIDPSKDLENKESFRAKIIKGIEDSGFYKLGQDIIALYKKYHYDTNEQV